MPDPSPTMPGDGGSDSRGAPSPLEPALGTGAGDPRSRVEPTLDSRAMGDLDGRGGMGTHGLPTTNAAPAGERPGLESIGQYKILRLLGEGGLGVVYLAERRHPIVQKVAVKVIKPGMDSRAVLARFEAERQALALMDHPNIAKVLDAGATPAGYPYFVMEYIQGEPITTFCDRHQLTIPQRLALFVQVCSAIQHAHTKGVIHRDIKPSNVLVSVAGGGSGGAGVAAGGTALHAGLTLGASAEPDVQGAMAKVIDFGVAKAMAQPLTERTLVTELGQLIGTPEYMSPEQAEMSALDIDTRSDVYSLGVLLYELLTGVLPFEARTLRTGSVANIQRTIRELEPPTPSTRLSTLMSAGAERGRAAGDPERPRGRGQGSVVGAIAAARRLDPEGLRKTLRSELEWIPVKAMRKARAERYQSPADLASDVLNYLAGRPLVAAPESALYRFRKLIARNRAAAGVIGLIMVILTVATIVVSIAFVRASEQRDRALAAERDAREQRDRALLAEADALVVLGALNGEPEAIAQLDRSLQIRRDLRQPESPEEAYTLYLKASLLSGAMDDGGQFPSGRAAWEARTFARDLAVERLLRESLAMARRLLENGQTTTALARMSGKAKLKYDVTSVLETAMSALSMLITQVEVQQRHAEAAALWRVRQDLARKDDPETGDYAREEAARGLATALVRAGSFDEARSAIRAAMDLLNRPRADGEPPDKWAVTAFLDELATAYQDHGRLRDAEDHLLALWAIITDPKQDMLYRVQDIAGRLAEVYHEMGDARKEEDFRRKAAGMDPALRLLQQQNADGTLGVRMSLFFPLIAIHPSVLPPPMWAACATEFWFSRAWRR